MIAHGERPLYRVTVASDISWTVNDLPDLRGVAASRRRAVDAARAAVAAFLEVDADAFDLRVTTTPGGSRVSSPGVVYGPTRGDLASRRGL